MINWLFGLMLAAGVGTWVYNYFHRQTGGNTQNALIMAGIAGLFAFVLFLMVLSLIT